MINVVFETCLGLIEIDIYIKRAPLSSVSFLEHVDNGLFTNGVGSFYRTLRPDNQTTTPVMSLIQGGLEFGKSPLQSIPHESTKQTGLSHTDGIVSLARTTVGSANGGAFFICIGDQSSIFDYQGTVAKYGGDYTLGFAAFGKVLKGMDIVNKIQWGKICKQREGTIHHNQILEAPVPILQAYRK